MSLFVTEIFFSRKQTGIAVHITGLFQRESINAQKSNAEFAADLAQLRKV